MKTAKINLYNFSELSEKAKQKAISEHEDFLLSIGQQEENEQGQLVTVYAETMEESEVIESIEANEYLFFADGDMAHCVTYCGKHERAGQTDFKFSGETYSI